MAARSNLRTAVCQRRPLFFIRNSGPWTVIYAKPVGEIAVPVSNFAFFRGVFQDGLFGWGLGLELVPTFGP